MLNFFCKEVFYKILKILFFYKLGILQGEGKSIRNIAKILERSPSIISRELNRPEVD